MEPPSYYPRRERTVGPTTAGPNPCRKSVPPKTADDADRCYAGFMSDDRAPASGSAAMAGDTRAIVRSIIGTGIGLATLLLMLIGLMVQQNAAMNARIDDVNTGMNARIDDVNARIDDVNTSVNARIDDLRSEMNRRFDDLQQDIRELRTLVIEALRRTEPAG